MASVSISCPSCSATDGVVRNGKSTAGHQRYLCSHCRKTWQLQFTYTASQPGTHQKIIDMAMNGVGCRATARIMGVGLNTIFRHLKKHTQQLVLGSLAFMVVFLHWLTKPTKAAAGIGLANRKPCTVSQPACRNHARQSGVSTPSATTSIVVFRRRLH